MFSEALSGSSIQSMNSSAVPGCRALAGMAMQSEPTGIPSLHVWKRNFSGSLVWERTLIRSPFQAWWTHAVPLSRFGAALRGEAAQELLLALQRRLGLLELGGIDRVEVEPVEEVRLPDALLEVVEHEDLALGGLEREVVPGAGEAR